MPWPRLMTRPDADERPAPEQQRGTLTVGPAGPDGEDQECGTHEQGAGEQPRHHVAEAGVEQPGEAGGAPLARRAGPAAADDAAGLVPGEATEAVVAEDQVENAVVLRPADVGTVGGRGERDRGHPPAGGHQRGHAHHDDLPDPPPPSGGRGQQVDDDQGGDDEEGLQHFGEEAEADQRAGQHQPLRLGLLERRAPGRTWSR